MQEALDDSNPHSPREHGRFAQTGGFLDAARYYAAMSIFGFGAVCFYLFVLLRTSWVDSAKAQLITRRTIHNGARLLFFVLECLRLVRISENLRGEGRVRIIQPRVVVANHPSLLDALLLLSVVPNGVCIMKRALRTVPIISGLARRAGYIAYSEAPELIHAATAELKKGGVLVIFPEGTRSPTDGCGTLQRGAVRIALEADVPLEVYGLRMLPVVLGRGLTWWRPPQAPIHYEVVRLDSVKFEIDRTEGSREMIRTKSIQGTQWLEERLKSWVS